MCKGYSFFDFALTDWDERHVPLLTRSQKKILSDIISIYEQEFKVGVSGKCVVCSEPYTDRVWKHEKPSGKCSTCWGDGIIKVWSDGLAREASERTLALDLLVTDQEGERCLM